MEFEIHVEGEKDFRYSGGHMRDLVIEKLVEMHLNLTAKSKFKIFQHDQPYLTTEEEIKKEVKCTPLEVTLKELKKINI